MDLIVAGPYRRENYRGTNVKRVIHAPILGFLSSSFQSQPKPSPWRSSMASSSSVRIVVVGDVHDDWDLEEDTKALQFLKLLHYSRDYGNGNVELVENVAALNFPKAVVLGNHDSWNTQQFSGKRKDRVQLQLECPGEEHVGYKRLDFPLPKLSIVGGRPFSCGDQQIFRKKLLSARYGVEYMDGSAKRIYEAAIGTPVDHSVILLAHNGPTGLGSELNDICGKDWVFGGGDHGDPDLAQAIAQLQETAAFSVPLIVFGHMHKELAHGNGLRKMVVVGADNTVYLNGAIVPRVKRSINEQQAVYGHSNDKETLLNASTSGGTRRAFTIVGMSNGQVDKISESWVSVVGNETTIEEEHILFKSSKHSSL